MGHLYNWKFHFDLVMTTQELWGDCLFKAKKMRGIDWKTWKTRALAQATQAEIDFKKCALMIVKKNFINRRVQNSGEYFCQLYLSFWQSQG